MKKQFLLIAFLAIGLFSFDGPEPDAKIFSSSQLVWCGLDFSQAKCIGSEGFTEPDQVKDRYFEAWNDLILGESDKYNVKEFYQKDKLVNDLSVVSERNKIPNADELVINEPYAFEEGQLESIIGAYNLEEAQDGLGVVYVVESLNKTEKKAVINVVFFDIASKDILWTKQYEESPGGFGFRNYWARAVLNTMESSEKDFKKALKRMK